MTYLHINQVFEQFRYPAGESHLRLLRGIDVASLSTIEAPAFGFDDLGQILTANDVLARHGVDVEWFVPYFPFARHDRRIDITDGFELGVALRLVENLQLVIADAHSDVAGQLPQLPQESVVDLYRREGVLDADTIVVIPDAGAAKKAYEWVGGNEVIQCLKHRDQMTGKLSGFKLLAGDVGGDLEGRPCIIVDDICDGGGTFLGVAAELQKANAGPITLAITHGLFTKGTDHLLESFERVVTFGPGPAGESDRIIRMNFKDLYQKGTRR